MSDFERLNRFIFYISFVSLILCVYFYIWTKPETPIIILRIFWTNVFTMVINLLLKDTL